MLTTERIYAGLKILGVYFLVHGLSSLIHAVVMVVSAIIGASKFMPGWDIIIPVASQPFILLLAAFTCLRYTQFVLRFCGITKGSISSESA